MPFTMHSDILDQYWRSHWISHHGIWNLPALMISKFGFPSAALLLTDWFHGVWLWMIGPMLPDIHRLFLDSSGAMVILTDAGGHQEAVLHFLSAGPVIWWCLFLFKLPYLILDFVALCLLLRLVEGDRTERRLVAFWMLNFVSLFTLYVWGRYDILAGVFILWALVAVRKGKLLAGYGLLGVATVTKYYPVFFLAPWILGLGKRWRDRIGHVAIYFAAPVLIGVLGLYLSFDQAGESILNVGYQIKNVVRIAFDVGDIFWKEPFYLYPFVVAYAGLCLYDWYGRRRGFDAVVGSSVGYLMVFYALAAFSPQYFFWSLPFVALTLHRRSDLLPLHLVQVLFFVLGMLELGSDLLNTLAPVFPSLVTSPFQPRYYAKLAHIYPVVVGIFRSLLSASCLFMAYLLMARNPPSPPWEEALGEKG